MSLKTNPEMPVHLELMGCTSGTLKRARDSLLYWGDGRFMRMSAEAISAAVTSITDALKPAKLKHEIDLVQRNIDFSGLDQAEREALLKYLDPFEEAYNERHDVTTTLIGFDFDGFAVVAKLDPAGAEAEFVKLCEKQLASVAPKLADALTKAGLQKHPIELFFFPMPSVKDFRDSFQSKIGWKQ